MRVEFHPAAQAEAEDAQAWYEQWSLIAAAGFLRELSDADRRAANSPERYPKSAAELVVPCSVVSRSPFYRIQSDVLLVVAVAHQKRRPGYWQAR